MADITINSHDVLGKLSIIKNYLAVVLEIEGASLSPKQRNYLNSAMVANESLITYIKQQSGNATSEDVAAAPTPAKLR
ncbi:hypothetical protein HY468_04625 [Candidatus Roizmanbacteria bacterium]|nr:hypothetical protein [Candidatus Roizmanbacteria bacterium]